jgi:TPR repeat protein
MATFDMGRMTLQARPWARTRSRADAAARCRRFDRRGMLASVDRLVATLAALAVGCSPASVVVAPTRSPSLACPVSGCAVRRGDPSAGARVLAACEGGAKAICAGRSVAECAEAALAVWQRVDDPPALACLTKVFAEACDSGDAQACGFAGRLMLSGRDTEKEPDKGLALLERACDGGFAVACSAGSAWLVDANHASEIPTASEMRARFDLKQACLSGEANPCYELGLSYYFGRDSYPSDRALAVKIYERACDLGESRACNNLGDALFYGEGTPRSVEHAAVLFGRACHLGEALGCANLGYAFEYGDGVTRDEVRANELYRDACVTGEAYGCLHAAMLAAVKRGAPRDPSRALAYWTSRCDTDKNSQSCAFVGVLYEDGPDGRARDETKSHLAMTRACELGERLACEWLKDRVEQ